MLLRQDVALGLANFLPFAILSAMEYRKLGKTGWNVSIIGYGAAPLGGVYGKLDEKKGIRSVHTAVDLGINFIDTAPYYGATVSETVLGKTRLHDPCASLQANAAAGKVGPITNSRPRGRRT